MEICLLFIVKKRDGTLITSKKILKIFNFSFFSVKKVLNVYLPKLSYYGYIYVVYTIFHHVLDILAVCFKVRGMNKK